MSTQKKLRSILLQEQGTIRLCLYILNADERTSLIRALTQDLGIYLPHRKATSSPVLDIPSTSPAYAKILSLLGE